MRTADDIHGEALLQRALIAQLTEPWLRYETRPDGTRVPIPRDLASDQRAKKMLWEVWGVDIDGDLRAALPLGSPEQGERGEG